MSKYILIQVGINLSFARLLLEGGCNVLIADLGLRPEAQVIVDKHSGKGYTSRAVFQQTDVTDWQQLDRMFEVAEREFGEIDVVCPGAGVYEPVLFLHEVVHKSREHKLTSIDSTGATSTVLLARRPARTLLLGVDLD